MKSTIWILFQCSLFAFLLITNCGCKGSGNSSNSKIIDGFIVNPTNSGNTGENNALGGGIPQENDSNGNPIARVHNPEPGTLLLLGSGIATMILYRKKLKK